MSRKLIRVLAGTMLPLTALCHERVSPDRRANCSERTCCAWPRSSGRPWSLEPASRALGPVISLQRDLLQLQNEVIERFAAAEPGNQATLSDLLAPANAARNHVGDLLLHLREAIEEMAQPERRSGLGRGRREGQEG